MIDHNLERIDTREIHESQLDLSHYQETYDKIKHHMTMATHNEAPASEDQQDFCPVLYAPDFRETQETEHLQQALRYIYQANPLPKVCCNACNDHDDVPRDMCDIFKKITTAFDHEQIKDIVIDNHAGFTTGRRVAIIGSGVSALTAAYDLVTKGHNVVIYEAGKVPGGLLRELIEHTSLTVDQLDEDIDVILSLGIDLRLNMRIGDAITIEKLHTNFNAVLDTTGKFRADDSESLSASEQWLWCNDEITDPTDLLQAISEGHRIAADIHTGLKARMWRQS